jgi:hypothetical protein
MQKKFQTVLEKICAQPEREVQWLEMLSQLEYAGCRKIVKGVPFEKVDLQVLHHVMEEASHAFLLKGLVENRKPTHSAGPCALSQLGWDYFQAGDQGVSRLQGEAFHYPAVSWVIEQRVLGIYPLYIETTQDPEVRRILQRILAQEKRHGAQFEGLSWEVGFQAAALAWEAKLWEQFVSGLEAWVAESRSALAQESTAASL